MACFPYTMLATLRGSAKKHYNTLLPLLTNTRLRSCSSFASASHQYAVYSNDGTGRNQWEKSTIRIVLDVKNLKARSGTHEPTTLVTESIALPNLEAGR